MKALKVTGILLAVVVVCVAGAGIYVKTALPHTGAAPVLTIERTPERVARGSYLAHHVAVCMDCHSTRDWQLYAGPMVPGTLGGGGEKFTKEMGFPGTFYAPNITPFGIGDWTDGELFRAITTGVTKEGNALFPVMAYHRFGRMDKEDVLDIIAYIRTLPPLPNAVPASAPAFPVNFLINLMPQPAAFTQKPAAADPVAYGAYLVNAAGCVDCHSKTEKGKVIPGSEFGGGMAFRQLGGTLLSPNITFDPATGIGNWTKAFFIRRFRQYADSNYEPTHLQPQDLNTPMPWTMYAGMTEADLGAIYDYLKSLPPKNHLVARVADQNK